MEIIRNPCGWCNPDFRAPPGAAVTTGICPEHAAKMREALHKMNAKDAQQAAEHAEVTQGGRIA